MLYIISFLFQEALSETALGCCDRYDFIGSDSTIANKFDCVYELTRFGHDIYSCTMYNNWDIIAGYQEATPTVLSLEYSLSRGSWILAELGKSWENVDNRAQFSNDAVFYKRSTLLYKI